jgi:hypothetical protein
MIGRISSSFLNALKLDYKPLEELRLMPRKSMVVWLIQNYVEFCPETTYRPVCNVWGLS